MLGGKGSNLFRGRRRVNYDSSGLSVKERKKGLEPMEEESVRRGSVEASLVNGCNRGRRTKPRIRRARSKLPPVSRGFASTVARILFFEGKIFLTWGTSPCFLPCFCFYLSVYAIARTRECFAIGSNVWEKNVNRKKNFGKFCG